MAKGASGFQVKPVETVRETRKVAAGNSQSMHILKSTQIRFMCFVNLTVFLAGSQHTCNGGISFQRFPRHGLVRGHSADRNGAVRLAAATSGIDLSVQVGRALISYSNQALRTGHW